MKYPLSSTVDTLSHFLYSFLYIIFKFKIMHLKNFPKVRVKEYRKGYVVEIQKKKWYGKKYWVHTISVSGIESEPWYFSKKETAINEAVRFFDYDLIINSNNI